MIRAWRAKILLKLAKRRIEKEEESKIDLSYVDRQIKDAISRGEEYIDVFSNLTFTATEFQVSNFVPPAGYKKARYALERVLKARGYRVEHHLDRLKDRIYYPGVVVRL